MKTLHQKSKMEHLNMIEIKKHKEITIKIII